MRRAYLEYLLSYLPGHVARLRASDPDRAGSFAEQVDATVLVADLSGFTHISETLCALGEGGAAELTGLLNRTFRMLVDDVALARGGELIAFGGDGFTLLFLGDDHARLALTVALEIQEAMALFPVAETSAGEVPLSLRIGVASGSVFHAVVAPPGGAEVLLGGPVVRAAIDLQHACPRGGVLAAMDTLVSAGPGVEGEAGAAGFEVRALAPTPPRPRIERLALPEDDQGRETLARLLEPFVPPRVLPRIRSAPEAPHLPPSFVEGTALFMCVEGIPLEGGVAVLPALLKLSEAVAVLMRPLGEPLRKIDVDREGFKLILVYGPPDGSETHARGAALTAALVRKGLAPQDPEAGPGEGVRVRFGLASGRLWSGEVGSRRRREYTAIGDPMNLAARLAGRARPWEILCTEGVATALGDLLPAEALGPIPIRGRSDPVAAFRLGSTAALSSVVGDGS